MTIAQQEAVAQALSTSRHRLVKIFGDVNCVCGRYSGSDAGTAASEGWRDHLIAAALDALEPHRHEWTMGEASPIPFCRCGQIKPNGQVVL